MIKYCFLFFLITNLLDAQQKATSPFILKDYENMRDTYNREAKENEGQFLYFEKTYYSVKKLDSLLLIKDEFKRQYWIENGKKAEEITEKDIDQINDNIVLPNAIFKINVNGNQFYYINYDYSSTLVIETDDGKKITFNFNDDGFREGIDDKNLKLITENLYYKNYQLKRTETLSYSHIKVGSLQEFDNSGNITLEIDWKKDFVIPEKQIEQIAHKEIFAYLLNKYKDHPAAISDFKNSKITVHKLLFKEKEPAWFFSYKSVQGYIDAKTGKLLTIAEITIHG